MRTTIIILIMLVLLPLQAFGVGFDNSTVGNRATMTGAALSGLADDASAVYYNPAGMINPFRETTWDIEFGASFTATKFYYTNGVSYSGSNDKFVIPGLFITRKIDDRWAAGFGFYTPFAGGGVTYENFLQSGHELSAAAGYTAFTPVIAYKVNDQWSVGLGLSGYYGIYKAKAFNPDISRMVELDYSGFAGVGAHGSVMYRPSIPWSIGLTFRTPVSTELSGKIKIAGTETDSKLEADFPYSFDLGIGYRKDRLKLGASFVWMPYGQMGELKQTTAGMTTVSKTGFKDGFRVSIGGEYQLSQRLYLIAGVRYVSAMQKDEFIVPTTDEVPILALSGALRFGISKALDLIVGYMHTEGFEKEVGAQKFDQDYKTGLLAIRAQF